jgi:hypothetical protein
LLFDVSCGMIAADAEVLCGSLRIGFRELLIGVIEQRPEEAGQWKFGAERAHAATASGTAH